MPGAEPGGQRGEAALRDRRHADVQLVSLADEPAVGGGQHPDPAWPDAVPAQLAGQAGRGVPVPRRELGQQRGLQHPQHRARLVDPQVGGDQPGRGEQPRVAGHQHAAQARLPQQQPGVQRSRAAERDQGVLAGVDAAFDRHPAQRRGHLRHRHLHDAVRGVLGAQAELPAGLRHRTARRAGVQREAAGQLHVRRQRARYHVRVGDGGAVASPPERGGAGRRAGALRADPQPPGPVHPGDAAATRPGGDDVHRRAEDRVVPDGLGGRDRRHAVADQAHIQRGPAHVEGHEPAQAVAGAQRHRSRDAGRRAGEHQPVRLAVGPLGGQAPAAGLHDQQRRVDAEPRRPRPQLREVAAHDRAQSRVERRRRRPRVLAELARHRGGHGDRHVGQALGQRLGQRVLVAGVEVAEQEADRHRRGPPLRDLGHHPVDLLLRQRGQHLAAAGQPLGHLDPVPPRHQFARAGLLQVVDGGTGAVAVAEDVAEPRGRGQHHPGQPAGQQRVGGDRRAVEQHPDVPRRHPRGGQPGHGALEGEAGVGGRGGHLGHLDQPVGGDRDRVGVGAAGVDRDDPGRAGVAGHAAPRAASARARGMTCSANSRSVCCCTSHGSPGKYRRAM